MTLSTFDSNILVYSFGAARDPAKKARARQLIARGIRHAGACALMLQAIAEFANVATRKLKILPDVADHRAKAWQAVLPVHAAVQRDVTAALAVVRDHNFQFWDAMLWAAARRVGVTHLLTEDLQDGRVLDGVRFVNPFAQKNDALVDQILPP